jgi:type III secretory pathway component EscU
MGILFWYKVITLPMIFYTAIHYKKQELYYYQNLGVSKLTLGISTSVFDFSIWLILSILIFKPI